MNVPTHAAIILDGNGRWALSRGKPRTEGHLEGLRTARRIVEAASRRGVSYLTLYVFSTENWRRAQSEVDFILGLVKTHLLRELDFYKRDRLRIRHAGNIAALPPDIASCVREAVDATREYTGLNVILALNYGGRDEVVRAVNRWLNMEEEGAPPPTVGCGKPKVSLRFPPDKGAECDKQFVELPGAFSAEALSACLDNPDVPDPDLIIRTAGERRLSNFLLWESAYAEYWFTDKLWPDFTAEDLDAAFTDYAARTRRFGSA